MHRNRKNIRLKGYDYSSKGLYFITICTKEREHYFGKIEHQKFEYSPIGAIAYTFWNEIPNHFRNIRLGEYKIMPNHIHGIIEIVKTGHGLSQQSSSEFPVGHPMGWPMGHLMARLMGYPIKMNSAKQSPDRFRSSSDNLNHR